MSCYITLSCCLHLHHLMCMSMSFVLFTSPGCLHHSVPPDGGELLDVHVLVVVFDQVDALAIVLCLFVIIIIIIAINMSIIIIIISSSSSSIIMIIIIFIGIIIIIIIIMFIIILVYYHHYHHCYSARDAFRRIASSFRRVLPCSFVVCFICYVLLLVCSMSLDLSTRSP